MSDYATTGVLCFFVSAAIMAIGLASMVGEYTTLLHLPFSSFSIDCTIFGLFGMIISGIFSLWGGHHDK